MHRAPRGGQERRRLPGGAEPDPAGHQRAGLGDALLRRSCSALLYKFALARPEEGHGRPHRADPRRPRRRRVRSEAEADQILAEYQAQLADAKNEAARIIEEARQTADAMQRDLEARAEAEIAEMRQRAAADIEAAKAQAIADLRSEVASLAIGAAEQVVEQQPRP